jgi:hypothetical protein
MGTGGGTYKCEAPAGSSEAYGIQKAESKECGERAYTAAIIVACV